MVKRRSVRILHTTLKPKVFVGMSGGVDSSVAALLLHEQGYDVIGAFIKNWSDEVGGKQLCWVDDRRDALRVAARLRIPLVTFDFEPEFRKYVVDYLYSEYAAGRTPNPDIMCNKFIKFPLLLREAKKLGADYIATGHYVRSKKHKNTKTQTQNYELYKAVDKSKDQSYFLYTLDQKILRHCIFPLGELTKKVVRKIARGHNLPTAGKPDSQGICFVGEMNMRDFLRKRIKEKPGKIVTVLGDVLGNHEGLAPYTIGQRQGIGVGGRAGAENEPLYVVAKDLKNNNLIVGPKNSKELYSEKVELKNLHWISKNYGLKLKKTKSLKIAVKIRYRADDAPAILKFENGKHILYFLEPERAAASGQSAVFYDGEKILGGGIIESGEQAAVK